METKQSTTSVVQIDRDVTTGLPNYKAVEKLRRTCFVKLSLALEIKQSLNCGKLQIFVGGTLDYMKMRVF